MSLIWLCLLIILTKKKKFTKINYNLKFAFKLRMKEIWYIKYQNEILTLLKKNLLFLLMFIINKIHYPYVQNPYWMPWNKKEEDRKATAHVTVESAPWKVHNHISIHILIGRKTRNRLVRVIMYKKKDWKKERKREREILMATGAAHKWLSSTKAAKCSSSSMFGASKSSQEFIHLMSHHLIKLVILLLPSFFLLWILYHKMN